MFFFFNSRREGENDDDGSGNSCEEASPVILNNGVIDGPEHNCDSTTSNSPRNLVEVEEPHVNSHTPSPRPVNFTNCTGSGHTNKRQREGMHEFLFIFIKSGITTFI